MSTTEATTSTTTVDTQPVEDLKLEAVVIPVSDVDRAKAFYAGLGWRLDADFAFDNGFRVVQFTPPGSPASVQFGTNITTAEPGSAQGLYLVVSDIQAARDELAAHGVEISEVFHPVEPGAQFVPGQRIGPGHRPAPTTAPATALSPPSPTPTATPGCCRRSPLGCPAASTRAATSFASVHDLEQALVRAATAHGEHEARNGGEYDEQWPAWYAAYMVAEQSGAELPR